MAKKLGTNISEVAKAAGLLASSMRTLHQTDENTSYLPGWKVFHPSPMELAQIRDSFVIESQDGVNTPYLLPREGKIWLFIEKGCVALYDDNNVVIDQIDGESENNSLLIKSAGYITSVRAVTSPVSVLIVIYKDRPNDQYESIPR